MTIKKSLLFLLFCLILPVRAQFDVPLQGAVIGINTVQQDRILLYELQGDRYRELSFGAQQHHLWDFSPDGCRVLFTLSDDFAPGDLYTAKLDGSDLQAVISYDEVDADLWGIIEAQWQPGGDLIAFTMQRQLSGREQYHIGRVSTNNPIPEFYSVAGREFSPQWSPDGEWLVYIGYQDRAAGIDMFSTAVPTVEPIPGQAPVPLTYVTEADLWLVRADGTDKVQHTSFFTGSVTKPRWSPDGETISFVHSPTGGIDTLWIIGSDPTARPAQLSFARSLLLDSTWLPDSTALIASLRDFKNISENRLWHIPLVGRADDAAFQYLESFNLSHADYPRFSPDGRWLATRSAYELTLIDLETRQTLVLDDIATGNTPVIWSPEAFNDEQDCD